jgi:DNA-binding HxlR family transcriptional regulator
MAEVIVRDAALAQDPIIRCIDARFCEIVRTEYELAEAPSTAFVALAMCIWGHTKKTVNISTSVIMPCEAEQTWLNKLAHAGIVVREAPPRPPEEEAGCAINAPI